MPRTFFKEVVVVHHLNFSLENQANVHKLLEFYRALAPVCIGGPSSTTLELEVSDTTKDSNSSPKEQGKVGRNISTSFLPYNYITITEY